MSQGSASVVVDPPAAGWRMRGSGPLHSSGHSKSPVVRAPCPADRRTLGPMGPGPEGGNCNVPTRAYELMIIVDQDADDAANRAVIERVKEMVAADGGTTPTVDNW